ncbi:MAG: GNAT family N-acetyltransferase, partial [Moraxellaceae bacterium]|nr:GNAT family N-acetyltransferase [Moraxellaceae bacterium]
RQVDSLYLHDLAVLPRMKGQRLAQWLVQHAWARAWSMGLRSSALVAVQDSLPFWSRLGYARHAPLAPSQAVHLRSYGDGQYLVRHFTG